MPYMKNRALERLENGEIALGVGVRLARSVEIAKMMRASDFDWLFIDLEHCSLSLETVAQIPIAADDNNVAPIVRVPTRQWDMASRALDGGAPGIVMAHMDTVDDAARDEALALGLSINGLCRSSTTGSTPGAAHRPCTTISITKRTSSLRRRLHDPGHRHEELRPGDPVQADP
jgi:hypothetical protein